MKNHVLAQKTHLGKYLVRSNLPVYQLLFLLPLLVIYEIAAVLVNFNAPFELRNGADILLKYALYGLGVRSVFSFVLATLLFVSLMLIVAMKKYKKRVRWGYFVTMFGETLIYAFIIGLISSQVAVIVTSGNPFLAAGRTTDTVMHQLMIGIGAGVYEEIVFRALLITIVMTLLKYMKVSDEKRTVIAVFLSSFLFSAFHYVGEFGEVFNIITFTYRLVAGILLSALYVFRGLGICAWSHAIYDVYVVFGIL